MLHLFLEKGPWFRAKRYGYGAGLPFKWQGWVFLLAHIAAIVGTSLALADKPLIMLPAIFILAFAPLPIYAARTEGGWKWRSGD
ncbi:MAG: hypothetical protein WA793_03015 [Sphingorhabdus sp.]|uniref:hypothetical protein n=1 Tax=Sphingorhabdus sp. TaxID=1902408 RepID=UPI003C82A872